LIASAVEIRYEDALYQVYAPYLGKWGWLWCTQMGDRGQRKMEMQRKDVKNCPTEENYWRWWKLLRMRP